MMIALGAGAVVLCGVQLGPILFGGSLAPPPPAKKKGADGEGAGATVKTAAPRAAPRASGHAPSASKSTPRGSQAGSEPVPIEAVSIDLSAVGRRAVAYAGAKLRNPFSAAEFETKKNETALSAMKLRLQGIVRCGRQRLAIIENRVRAEGEEVAPGVRMISVEECSVVLSDGKTETRLSLSPATLKAGRP